ncbi:hypothetical protein KSF_075810 [Reticulibacter mediterranei]|uniref:Uncharacterized protein n=1 Tax=Reticulibacter mediterranei TaxID=2778369 RepID=A0A8J3IP10_9CHLR|nr:hypothetical protein [Reticulibacter mediterranei]GHO97533.1 hypothetical protein KSF_075810 [Reticulibacter mediterranei]
MIQLRSREVTPSQGITPAEMAALQLVSVDQAMSSVSANKRGDTTRVAATTVSNTKEGRIEELITACYCAYMTICECIEAERVDIPEEALEQLGPAASVRKLLAMRHDLLANPRREVKPLEAATSVNELLKTRR